MPTVDIFVGIARRVLAHDEAHDAAVRNAGASGRPRKPSDGQGLSVLIQPSGSKLWRFHYRLAGRHNDCAIGAYPEVPLAKAREERR